MIEFLLFFTMQICVIAGSGYDCDWKLIITSYDSVEKYCPLPPIEFGDSVHTDGCADFAKRTLIVHKAHMGDPGYYGMNVLWHEIRHAYLYSDCMVQLFTNHFKCTNYADWHG